ncbi:MAG TPA: NAD(P)-binding protein, partial [Rubellimicrobium sp.]|nr:NAD(P)-binding protein [Rubellimicrobium sp.]
MAKRRIAVLGGGVGAMSAAWALTSRPGAQDDYEVHVYQVGWRLGGKGASGRNRLQGQRIEEHGLHIWSGFYDNAFRVMRDCFDEIQDEPRTYHSVDEAFFPDNNIVLGERTPEGWKKWAVRPLANDGVPGVGGNDLSPWGYFLKLVALMRETLDRLDPDQVAAGADLPRGAVGDNILQRLAAVGQALGEAPLHLLEGFASMLRGEDAGRGLDQAGLGHLTRQVQDDIKARRARSADRAGIGDDIRRGLQLLDLGGAVLRGMVEDRVLTRGFDAIDNEEVSAWLEKHGAEPESVDGSLILAVYDYVFGFRGGATVETARAIAAGTFLRGTLRLMLTYKGAIFYKMNAGMGDTIFTPLYKALRKRGVHFHFFHRVRGLHLDPTSSLIDSISVARQVTIRPDAEGRREYQPFVTVKGHACGPSAPLWAQIEEAGALKGKAEGSPAGDEAGGRLGSADLESSWTDWQPVEKLTLRRGQDFDEVILGIPVGALPSIASELLEASAAWKRMVTR